MFDEHVIESISQFLAANLLGVTLVLCFSCPSCMIQLAAYIDENSLMMYMIIIFFIQLTFILLQVEKNGIDNEYVPGITTSKYLINKLRELAKVGTYKVVYITFI
jgi:Fe-S oxidoreductase